MCCWNVWDTAGVRHTCRNFTQKNFNWDLKPKPICCRVNNCATMWPQISEAQYTLLYFSCWFLIYHNTVACLNSVPPQKTPQDLIPYFRDKLNRKKKKENEKRIKYKRDRVGMETDRKLSPQKRCDIWSLQANSTFYCKPGSKLTQALGFGENHTATQLSRLSHPNIRLRGRVSCNKADKE